MDKQISYSRQSSRDKATSPAVPKINCCETVVFCIDLSTEFESLKLRSRAGDVHSGLSIAVRCVRMYILNKLAISENMKFGLMCLHKQAQWVLLPDDAENVSTVLDYLEDMTNTEDCQQEADISSMFKLFLEKVPPPSKRASSVLPEYCVRLILVYGRSECVPQLTDPQWYNMLQCSPVFFFDTLYLHEHATEVNSVQKAFDALCDLDEKGVSYVLTSGSNMTRAYNNTAQLLAHPLQRPLQSEATYKLILPPPDQQIAHVLETVS